MARLAYTRESRVTSIFLNGAFWGIAVMTGTRFEWEVHQWTGHGLSLICVVHGMGSFDEAMAEFMRGDSGRKRK